MNCLTNVVGLASSDCVCYEDNRPVDFDTSTSGLYLTDYVPLKFTSAAADCEQGGVWEILTTARTLGIKAFLNEFGRFLGSKKQNRFQPFQNDYIGQFRYKNNNNLSPNSTVCGVRFVPLQVRGGNVVVTGFDLALGGLITPTAVTVYVYSSANMTTPVDSLVVNLTASNVRAAATFSTPVVLDISNTDPALEYYFLFSLPVGATYQDTTVLAAGTASGGCCGRVPESQQAAMLRLNPFQQFGQWSGCESANLSDFPNNINVLNGNSYGLRIRASLGCDYTQWLCTLAENLAANNPYLIGEKFNFGIEMANLIQAKSASIAMTKIVDSANINKITLMSKEALWGKSKKLDNEFLSGVAWLVDNMPDSANDCWKCKDDKTSIVKQILI
jgi:hypothetical protein